MRGIIYLMTGITSQNRGIDKMITIDSFDVVKSETSSKGNQHKFYKDGYWIKLDSNKNSEGLAEEFASVFASCIQGFNYVKYKSIQVEYNSNIYNACISHNTLGVG